MLWQAIKDYCIAFVTILAVVGVAFLVETIFFA